MDTVANAMFVQISDEKAAQLASLPGVKRVLPMRYGTSPALTGTPEQLQTELLGSGIEICVLQPGGSLT